MTSVVCSLSVTYLIMRLGDFVSTTTATEPITLSFAHMCSVIRVNMEALQCVIVALPIVF